MTFGWLWYMEISISFPVNLNSRMRYYNGFWWMICNPSFKNHKSNNSTKIKFSHTNTILGILYRNCTVKAEIIGSQKVWRKMSCGPIEYLITMNSIQPWMLEKSMILLNSHLFIVPHFSWSHHFIAWSWHFRDSNRIQVYTDRIMIIGIQ